MKFWRKTRPSFWDKREIAPGASTHQFNYRRIWKLAVLLTGGVALVPLIFITVVNYEAMQDAIASEFLLRTTRIVSNTRRAISFFLSERKSALDFIVHDNSFESLNNKERLAGILENLKRSFGGGFVDIGVVDSSGFQNNYVGPYKLEGKNYSGQEWFKQVVDSGMHISDVFLGYRKVPHLVIAVKGINQNGSFYVLRSALSIAPFEGLLSNLELGGMGDAFMINHQGILQTPSRYHGNVLQKLFLLVPKNSPKTEVLEEKNRFGQDLLIGYRYIDDTPFILMIVKKKEELMRPWYRTRLRLIAFLLISVTVILTVILGTATYMVRRIQIADEKRVITLHQVEYANKMASIGRLAAGVAHEVNNPLAIINEKAGLIKDLFAFRGEYVTDHKLIGLVDSILASVKRAGTITRRLLNFSRNLEAGIEPINLKEVILEVLSFMGKEAELRSIEIAMDVSEDIPKFETDRGRLQQILLNIVNNAFAALNDGGHLDIKANREDRDHVSVIITDDGCGISKEDLNRIFEPFFSTKTGQGGTGLGLSITYGLVQEIGGKISVRSELGRGTSFGISIPIKWEKNKK
ncbi:MAG: ATP-binding protein [Desulfobacteraceae bacterium]|nr:ATP-binding protein [Desulfobacteraceae bacterium]MBL7171861.1 ATP-binding protein [Desulfobacteraceae bacterium]